jgi:hypothetical protein
LLHKRQNTFKENIQKMEQISQSSLGKKEFKDIELIEIRERIKKVTGFKFDEESLGLNEEIKGMREFQRLQAPLPHFLTEKEKKVYTKLLKDLITNIKTLKDEIFNIESKMINDLKDMKTGRLQGHLLDKKSKEYSNLESCYISLVIKLIQAEEAYKSLINNIEMEKRVAKESIETVIENRSEQEIKRKFNFLDMQKMMLAGKKDQLSKELENVARVRVEYSKKEEEWRKRREEHRKMMLHFIHECQERINLLNIKIEEYQKQLLSIEQKLLKEKNQKMKEICSNTKKELEVCLLYCVADFICNLLNIMKSICRCCSLTRSHNFLKKMIPSKKQQSY